MKEQHFESGIANIYMVIWIRGILSGKINNGIALLNIFLTQKGLVMY
jgi:hypothetical protein